MGKKRSRNLTQARMILWDRGAQARFVEAVEKVCELAGQLAITLHELREERKAFQAEMASKRSQAAARANATRKNVASERVNGLTAKEATTILEHHPAMAQGAASAGQLPPENAR